VYQPPRPYGVLDRRATDRWYRKLQKPILKTIRSLGLNVDDVYDLVNSRGVLDKDQAMRMYELLDGVIATFMGSQSISEEQRRAYNSLLEGMVRSAIGARAAMDAASLASMLDWSERDASLADAISFFLERAPKKTLLTIEDWLCGAVRVASRDVHERALLLGSLSRIRPDAANPVAVELFDQSPGLCAAVLRRSGAGPELEFLRSRLPGLQGRERLLTESAVREIERRMCKLKVPTTLPLESPGTEEVSE